jgi:hypothetical protein
LLSKSRQTSRRIYAASLAVESSTDPLNRIIGRFLEVFLPMHLFRSPPFVVDTTVAARVPTVPRGEAELREALSVC